MKQGAPKFRGLVGLALLSLGYAYGVFSVGRDAFPLPLLKSFKAAVVASVLGTDPASPAPARFSFDRFGRLSGDPKKQIVACPEQTERTAVLLLTGQSNAGNHAGQRVASQHGPQIVNFFAGRCFVAASPLLGATGVNGEYWTQLGNILIASKAYDRVVLAPVAVGSAAIERWARGGDLNALLVQSTDDLHRHNYRVTHVIWHQGENDQRSQTPESVYAARLASVVETLRSQAVDAPIFVSVASKCLLMAPHDPDNPVARAQRAMPGRAAGIRAGVDTDALLGDLDRYDDCHFAASGQDKVAAAWAQVMTASPPAKRKQLPPLY